MESVTCKLRCSIRSVRVKYILSLLLFYESQTDANMCTKQKINSIETNVSLPHHVFDKLYPGGLMLCARECKYRPRCKSFNYIESNGECQLNDDTMSGTVQNISGVVYGDINNWPENIWENCGYSFCTQLQKCEPNENSFLCIPAYKNVTNANHTTFLGHTFDVVTANTEDVCVQACMLRSACLSFNYKSDSNTCELNNEVMVTDYQSYIGNQPNSYYSNINLYDRAILGACACATHTCDQYSKCEDNKGSYTCTILYCPTPNAPYADIHVIPEFDLTKTMWSIGKNLSYSCWTSYYPNTDWTCLNNGTWQSPTCTAISLCTQLFNDCNPSYNNGTYVFKFPGTDSDFIAVCYTYITSQIFLRIPVNNTYGFYSTNYASSCHTDDYTCGKRIFNLINLWVYPTFPAIIATDDVGFTVTDCDGPRLHRAGQNCDSPCQSSAVGEFNIDIRGSGLKYTNQLTLRNGNLTFSDGDQVLHGECDACQVCNIPDNTLLLPSDREIHYSGAVNPVCKTRP